MNFDDLPREYETTVNLGIHEIADRIKYVKEASYSIRNGNRVFPKVECVAPDGHGNFVMIVSRLTDEAAREYGLWRARRGYPRV
jgi:hypothetical protein